MGNSIKRHLKNDLYNALVFSNSPNQTNPFLTLNDVRGNSTIKNASAVKTYSNNSLISNLVNTGWGFINVPSTAFNQYGSIDFNSAPNGGIKYIGVNLATLNIAISLSLKSSGSNTSIDEVLATLGVTLPSGNIYIQPRLVSRCSVGQNSITGSVASTMTIVFAGAFPPNTVFTPRVLTLSSALAVVFTDMQFTITKINENP